MPELYKGKIPIIRSSLNEGFIRGVPDEEPSYGCVARDYTVDPVEMRDSPTAMKVYEDSEIDAVYDEQERDQSSLEHLFLRGGAAAFEYLDQNGDGHCWAYSTVHAIMMDRLIRNLPPVRLNPHAIAAILRRLNGGWCGLSMKFVRERGVPVEGTGSGQWPKWSNNPRNLTAEVEAEMAKHKADEDWYDLGATEWNQTLTRKQYRTCGLANWPTPSDFMRFAHSMLTVRYVRLERGSWGPLVFNSWKGFGFHGLAVLREMWPDNACALRSSTASAS